MHEIRSQTPSFWARRQPHSHAALDAVRRDLEALQELGAPYVLLDTKRNSPTALSSQHHEESWRTLAILAEKAIDLDHETVR